MMKKKVLSVFLCAGLAVSMLAGCGSGNSDTKDKRMRQQTVILSM